MSIVKRNIVANFVGRGWAALMALAFIPLYIKFLGIEAYGLIGFFAMLQASFQVLDLGLSQTMNREMARYSVLPDKASESRDLVRTLEIGYWAIGIVIGALILAMAPFIAGHWIKSVTIPAQTVRQVVMIMGVVTALQWPLSFYDGGLMGLQKQVLSNSIKIGMATVSNFGAIFILWKVSPTISAFFTWQIIVSALSVILSTFFLWRSLPRVEGFSKFNFGLLRNIWRFAAGMGGISISGVILTQMDKIILSKLLSLEMFGYYILACAVSNVIPSMLVRPVFSALFPQFSSLVAKNDQPALTLLYHQGSQLIAVLVLPVAAVLVYFSFDVLLLWTGSVKAAEISSPIVSVLVVGWALNALMNLPFAIQISYGWTTIGLRINIIFIITLVPAVYIAATLYGAYGAAYVWAALNSIYMLIGVPLTHRRLLQREMRSWFVEDIGLPLTVVFIIVGIGRWIIASPMQPITAIASLSAVLVCALMVAALSAPRIRAWILAQVPKR